MSRVINPGPISFSHLPAEIRQDRLVRRSLFLCQSGDIKLTTFSLIALSANEIRLLGADPDVALEADDHERGYRRIMKMVDIYLDRGPDALPPIMLARQGTRWEVIDGFHRLSAAREARLDHLRAYLLLPG